MFVIIFPFSNEMDRDPLTNNYDEQNLINRIWFSLNIVQLILRYFFLTFKEEFGNVYKIFPFER